MTDIFGEVDDIEFRTGDYINKMKLVTHIEFPFQPYLRFYMQFPAPMASNVQMKSTVSAELQNLILFVRIINISSKEIYPRMQKCYEKLKETERKYESCMTKVYKSIHKLEKHTQLQLSMGSALNCDTFFCKILREAKIH